MVEKIRELCKKQGTSLTKLEVKLGFGNGVIGRWDKHRPSFDRLKMVADALGTTVADLTGESEEKSPSQSDGLTDRERALIRAFRAAPKGYQDSALSLLESAPLAPQAPGGGGSAE